MSKFSEDVPREIVRALENQAFDIAKIKVRLSNQFQEIVDVEERLYVLEQSREEPVDIQKANLGTNKTFDTQCDISKEIWAPCPSCYFAVKVPREHEKTYRDMGLARIVCGNCGTQSQVRYR